VAMSADVVTSVEVVMSADAAMWADVVTSAEVVISAADVVMSAADVATPVAVVGAETLSAELEVAAPLPRARAIAERRAGEALGVQHHARARAAGHARAEAGHAQAVVVEREGAGAAGDERNDDDRESILSLVGVDSHFGGLPARSGMGASGMRAACIRHTGGRRPRAGRCGQGE